MAQATEDICDFGKLSIDDTHEPRHAPAPSPSQKGLSPFERLPLEIRELIYENLLVSSHVKIASSSLKAASYNLQSAILATNSAIYREARPVLDRNIFVIVVTTFKDICNCLKGEGVPIVSSSSRAVLFMGHLLSIEMQIPTSDCGPLQAFLMVAEDLPKLCRFIRLQRLIMEGEPVRYCIVVRLTMRSATTHHRATLSKQKLLLEHFKKASIGMVQVDIAGRVDPAYREKILADLKPDMHVTSRLKWSDYQLCREIKQEGDAAFRLGNWKRAKERYILQYKVFKSFHESLPRPPHHLEGWVKWAVVMYNLHFRTIFNALLLSIRTRSPELVIACLGLQVLRRETSRFDCLRKSDEARMNHYIGLTFAELGENERAAGRFVEAFRLSPKNKVIQESLDVVKRSQARVKHRGISECVISEPILEEAEGRDAEVELETWQTMFKAVWAEMEKKSWFFLTDDDSSYSKHRLGGCYSSRANICISS